MTTIKPPARRVFLPGETGYHGPRTRTRESDARTTNYNRAWQERKGDQRDGKVNLGIAGLAAASPLLAVPVVNHTNRRQAAAARKQTARVQKEFRPYGKPWNVEDVKIKHVKPHRGVHNVSSFIPKATFAERMAKPGPATAAIAAGGLLGSAGMVAATVRGANEREKAERQLRAAKRRAKVAKRGPKPSLLREHFGTPRKAVATVRRNPEYVASGTALATAGALQSRSAERRRTPAERDRADVASAALAGGVGGQAAFRGAGYTVRHIGHTKERQRPEGMSRSQHQKIMSNHYKTLGLRQNEKTADPKFYRTYPKGLPATPYKRVLGQTSGKRGAAMLGAATIGGAYAAGASVRGRKQSVAKAIYVREERTSPARVLQLGAGVGMAAWGLGRSGMVGRALATGIRAGSTRGSDRALYALQAASAAQGVLRRGTAPGERALRQVQMVSRAIDSVPARMRPEIAAAAGVLLAGNAIPVNRKTYRPANPYSSRGW